MKHKNENATKPDTWFGLNKPEAKATDVDAVIFGIPYDGGVSYRGGAAQAPDLLRANTDHATPCTERLDYFDDFTVLDAGNFEGERDEVFAEVQDYVETLVRNGVRFTMIGGDHSVTIPVERGVNAALDEPFGIIHIDAHMDLSYELEGDPLPWFHRTESFGNVEHYVGKKPLFHRNPIH